MSCPNMRCIHNPAYGSYGAFDDDFKRGVPWSTVISRWPSWSCLPSPAAVLSIDRMENRSHVRRRYPRYHSSLFRGQPAWDPHTHVVLPLSVLSPPKAEGETVSIT